MPDRDVSLRACAVVPETFYSSAQIPTFEQAFARLPSKSVLLAQRRACIHLPVATYILTRQWRMKVPKKDRRTTRALTSKTKSPKQSLLNRKSA